MKKAAICLLTAAVLCVGQAPGVWALTDQPTIKPILITELQTGGATDATEEFVELYNPNDTAVNVTGWQLQYRAASGTSAQTWPASSTKATLACPTGSAANCTVQIGPQDRLVLVHTIANIAGAYPMAGGFSATGGEIRLIEPGTTPTVQDFIGYGTAADSEGTPADAPAPGKSLKRVQDTDDNPVDTDHNAADFIAGCGEPSPGTADTNPLPYTTGCKAQQTDDTPTQSGQSTDSSDTSDADQQQGQTGTSPTPTYLPILVTEVFPDPAAPAQDSADEFIELYNPNDTTVTLNGYVLQTGTDWRYHFTLGDTPLGPHDYYAVRSAVSKLSLSNSGSGVRLIDPNGQTAFEIPTYGDAKEGQAWMPSDGVWQWTLTPTPNAPNILTVPALKPAPIAGTVPKKTTKTAAAAAKKTTPKTAVPKLPKATKKSVVPKTTATTGQASTSASTPQYWLLAPIGAIAGGYALYEYRAEIGRGSKKLLSRFGGKKQQQLLGDDAQDLV